MCHAASPNVQVPFGHGMRQGLSAQHIPTCTAHGEERPQTSAWPSSKERGSFRVRSQGILHSQPQGVQGEARQDHK